VHPEPNLFLIGAAKSGTTSLHAYLGQHPQIYVSPIKEPCYFADEVRPEYMGKELLRTHWSSQRKLRAWLLQPKPGKCPQGVVLDWESYVKLFGGAKDEIAIGEASVSYLWSPTAPRHIAERIPEARILMILRNPAERAFSHYLDFLTAGAVRHSFREHIRLAMAYRENRMGCYYPFLELGCYAVQVQRYLELFPREQIHVMFYEDFQSDPALLMEGIFRFLKVDPDIPIDMSKRHRQARVPRFGTAGYLLKRMGVWQRGRKLIPNRIASRLKPLALAPRSSLVMDTKDRAYLVSYYRDEIRDLEELLNRDLSSWLRY
jgi:hypothetical protein